MTGKNRWNNIVKCCCICWVENFIITSSRLYLCSKKLRITLSIHIITCGDIANICRGTRSTRDTLIFLSDFALLMKLFMLKVGDFDMFEKKMKYAQLIFFC
jgi:hypothetical protein